MRKYNALFLSVLLALSACDSAPEQAAIPPRREIDAASRPFADKQFAVYDPVESVNKQIYKFNAQLDEYVLLPIVNGYTYITPEFARTGVANFFQNVGEVTNFTNAVLQLNAEKAGTTLGRFVVNTTVGLAGTFDVATKWGLKLQPEDFGKTLGHWGVASGAYVVIPVLGPSNVRDTVGKIVDYATIIAIIPHSIKETLAYDIVDYGVQPVNMRYVNTFRYYSSGSPFEYELVRYIVTQVRTSEIEKEKQH